MLVERLKWLGTLIVVELPIWLAWKQVAKDMPHWSQWAIVGAVVVAFLPAFPYTRNDDGTVRRLINFRQRGRGNVAIAPGDNSQVAGNITNTGSGTQTVHNHGLTVQQLGEIKKHVDDQVADKVEVYVDRRMDTFAIEVAKITGEANNQALTMGKYVVTEFIEKLVERDPENIKSLGTADMQHAILNAQTSAAITNDQQLADTLVDILVDKSGSEPRSFKGVVLNEALAVTNKLTANQVNLLCALLIVSNTIVHALNTVEDVLDTLDSRCRPLYGKIPTSQSTIQYLQYTGVGTTQVLRPNSMVDIIIRTYDAVFTRGFQLSELTDDFVQSIPNIDTNLPYVDERIATNEGNRRFGVASSQSIEKWKTTGALNEPYASHTTEIYALIENRHAPTDKVAELIEKGWPDLFRFLKDLDEAGANTFVLSSVGSAIGQANWRRLSPDSAPTVDIYLS